MKKEIKGYRLILSYIGTFLMFEGFITLIPLLLLIFYPEERTALLSFAIPGASAIVLGIFIRLFFSWNRQAGRLDNHENAFLLVFLWINGIILGALPFFISTLEGHMEMDFAKSIFESTSAYTTTGLTVFDQFLDVEGAYCPHIFLFHRALMQFIGGVGLVLILSNLLGGRNAMKLYLSEGHGDALMPNLAKSARMIFGMYTLWALLGAVGFYLFGMDPFEAVCNSMCNIATGGFATRSISFYSYREFEGTIMSPSITFTPVNTIGIEIIAILLMLIGITNFVLITFALKGDFKRFFKDCEIRYALIMLVLFSFLGAWQICTNSSSFLNEPTAFVDGAGIYSQGSDFSSMNGISYWEALRYSTFDVVSSMSTCGASNVKNLNQLGYAMTFISIYLMATGGGMGSTSGAIKQFRICVIFKEVWWNVHYHFASPRTINPKTIYRLGEKREIDEGTSQEAHFFTLLFVAFLLLGTLACACLPGVSLLQGCYNFTTALAGTGLSIVDFAMLRNANMESYYAFLWILTIGMFLGRLEIMPVYYSIRKVAMDPVRLYRKKHA
ncbi:MAG: TrkH family potassium uptake protein [Bacilli bacterium]|nr:TrkH family potassium uptake protein [Bacilli bacterium]